ncbi:MAG: hypothetical protein ABI632_06455 [Pseudolysinimonas sp.]
MRSLRVAALAIVAIALLSGCDRGPDSPTADPIARPPAGGSSSSATPTADPSAPAFVEVNAHSVGVGANNSRQLVDIPYTTDIATAAAQFSSTIGVEATVTPVAATPCAVATATYDWGGIEFFTDQLSAGLGDPAFFVSVTAPTSRAGLEIDALGQTVGTMLSDVLANVPGSVSGDRGEGNIEALIDPQDGGAWGVILHTQAGAVTDFVAPGYYLTGHGTCE